MKNEEGVTALKTAAYKGNISGVTQLLEAGADINPQGVKWKTALEATLSAYLISEQHSEIVYMLLRASTELSGLTTLDGMSFLQISSRWNLSWHDGIYWSAGRLRLRLEIGVDVNEGGKHGTTLQVALNDVLDEEWHTAKPPDIYYLQEYQVQKRRFRKKETFEILLGAGSDTSILDDSERKLLDVVLQDFNIQLPPPVPHDVPQRLVEEESV